MFRPKRLNRYDNIDQAGLPVVRRTDYRTLSQSMYKVIWLEGRTSPKPVTVLLSKRKVSYVFFVNQCITVSSSVSFSIFLNLFVSNLDLVITRDMKYKKNGIIYRSSRKCVCRIML